MCDLGISQIVNVFFVSMFIVCAGAILSAKKSGLCQNAVFITRNITLINTFAAKHLKKQYLSAKHVSRTPEY